MIKADIFYLRFDEGFTAGAKLKGLKRLRDKSSKWMFAHRTGNLEFHFQVNPKASATPHCPGEFWPLVQWEGQRYNERDTGNVSYYQYTNDSENEAIQLLRRKVIEKTIAQDRFENEVYRQMRDARIGGLLSDIQIPLQPNHPQSALYYLDEDDAKLWGTWFSENIIPWLARFDAAPESLETWCWRVLWKDLPNKS